MHGVTKSSWVGSRCPTADSSRHLISQPPLTAANLRGVFAAMLSRHRASSPARPERAELGTSTGQRQPISPADSTSSSGELPPSGSDLPPRRRGPPIWSRAYTPGGSSTSSSAVTSTITARRSRPTAGVSRGSACASCPDRARIGCSAVRRPLQMCNARGRSASATAPPAARAGPQPARSPPAPAPVPARRPTAPSGMRLAMDPGDRHGAGRR